MISIYSDMFNSTHHFFDQSMAKNNAFYSSSSTPPPPPPPALVPSLMPTWDNTMVLSHQMNNLGTQHLSGMPALNHILPFSNNSHHQRFYSSPTALYQGMNSLYSFNVPDESMLYYTPVKQNNRRNSRSSSPGDRSPVNKRYCCRLCNKRFTRPSSLTTHTYSHTGEKPFKCPVEGCGRHFSVVSNLRRHAKIHNNPTAST